ncbi:hypothetical protein G6L45_15295 [Agrobacterium rhizogenes]|nr:hypothetical protein [Rhizobium rhizogenes]NTG81170.1 hypothetical protein [Rhizobium rhizogenes]NTH96852.1 hypothetical protein [Rhizobium rhizogenes]NTJ15038.1 hypothetical protein [Rhizobium rhizogenes]
MELAYELAFLRVFMAWEVMLEGALLRLMCGFRHSHGQEPLAAGKAYQPTISDAEAFLLNGRQYLLWHNPTHVIARASGFFANSRYEIVLASAQNRIEHFATVRHRIAHSQRDASVKFDTVCMLLAGKRYMGSRPGRFLRDWQLGVNPPQRWFDGICQELESLSRQLCA